MSHDLRTRVESYLRAAAAQFAEVHPGYHYHGPADFVLQHGVWFDGGAAQLLPGGAPGKCFGTAIVFAARYGEHYFEGYGIQTRYHEDGETIADTVDALIPHAWTVHPDRPDQVRDRTWLVPGSIYVGVHFSVERADDATWNGNQCVLWDSERGFPLFREPWHGEDITRVWPPSDRLELARHPTPEGVRAWLQQNAAAAGPPQYLPDLAHYIGRTS